MMQMSATVQDNVFSFSNETECAPTALQIMVVYDTILFGLRDAVKYKLSAWCNNRVSRVSCQKGPICHAYAWRVGPFWQDTIGMRKGLLLRQ